MSTGAHTAQLSMGGRARISDSTVWARVPPLETSKLQLPHAQPNMLAPFKMKKDLQIKLPLRQGNFLPPSLTSKTSRKIIPPTLCSFQSCKLPPVALTVAPHQARRVTCSSQF